MNRSGPKIAEEISKEIKFMLDIRINAVKVKNNNLFISEAEISNNLQKYLQRIVNTTERTEYIEKDEDFYHNYEFYSTRVRDRSKKQLEEDEITHQLAQLELKHQTQLDKKRRKNDKQYAERMKNETKPPELPETKSCFSNYEEELNLTMREASVHLPIDIFDQGILK